MKREREREEEGRDSPSESGRGDMWPGVMRSMWGPQQVARLATALPTSLTPSPLH